MKEENNINVLNELNKGCSMGSNAIKFIYDKIEGKEFKNTVSELLEEYEDLTERINKLYSKYSDEEPEDNSMLSKTMTWYGIQIRTMTNSSATKLAEMLIQGLNMGIIDGKKLENHSNVDKDVINLVKDYIKMQEIYVEKIKDYL